MTSMPTRKATLPGKMASFFSRPAPAASAPPPPLPAKIPGHLSVPSSPLGGYQRQFSSSNQFLATTSLNGKVAVVTGATDGLGASIALCLGEQAANVVVAYTNSPSDVEPIIQAIRSQGKGGAIGVKADVSTVEGGKLLIEETLKTFGKIDILVLNAGRTSSKGLTDLDETFFDANFAANVKAPLFLAKYVAPILPSPGGRIIFFSSSMTDSSTIHPNALVHLATKGAIEQISRVLAKDLGARGITVNTISPGIIDTPEYRQGKSTQYLDSIAKQAPGNRMGTPDDIAPVVAFLAGQAGQWINGQNIRINGGAII